MDERLVVVRSSVTDSRRAADQDDKHDASAGRSTHLLCRVRAVHLFPKLKFLSYENRFKLYYEIQLAHLSLIINDIVSRNELLLYSTMSVNVFVFIKMFFWWRIR